MMNVKPILYKLTSTGKPQFWEISVEGSTIVTRWGQIDGKVQETRDVITEGKNTGKKNQTSPAEQALAEAESQWTKKLKSKGYVTSLESAKAGERDALVAGGVDPMLAHRFDEQGHKIKYPCWVQPKFDGHRCIAVIDDNGKCTLWSRTRKPITSMVHIQVELEKLGLKNVVLDGELYNHKYKDRFEELTSFIRDTKAKAGAEIVEYHVYDVIHLVWTQTERFDWLWATLKPVTVLGSPIVQVLTDPVDDEDDLMTSFETFLKLGYEGAMARNAAGTYANKRSYDLQKIKEFSDAEYEIIGVEEGRGKLAGHAIFVCKTKDGTEFRVKMAGETSALKQYWDNPKLAIGKHLTVKYQGLTNKSQVPRFPVGLRLREDV